jgi:uncharacterized membrane protein YdcZ (DUF606 family)
MFIMTGITSLIFCAAVVGNRSDHTWNRFGGVSWNLLGCLLPCWFCFDPPRQSVLQWLSSSVTNLVWLSSGRLVAWRVIFSNHRNAARPIGVINLMGGAAGVLSYVLGGMIYNSFGRHGPPRRRNHEIVALGVV